MVLTIDNTRYEIRTIGEAVPMVRCAIDTVADDKQAFRDAKLRLGWMLRLLREEFRDMPFEEWLEVVGLKRRTAYHTMRVAEQLADDSGRFSADKYRALCKARRRTPAERPDELALRRLEMDTGLRTEEGDQGNRDPNAPRGTHELAARLHELADVVAGLGGADWQGPVLVDGIDEAVAALEAVVRRVAN